MKRLATTGTAIIVVAITIVLFASTGAVSYSMRADATKQAEEATSTAISARQDRIGVHNAAVAAVAVSSVMPTADAVLDVVWSKSPPFDSQWLPGGTWGVWNNSEGSTSLGHQGYDQSIARAPRSTSSSNYAIEATFEVDPFGEETCLGLNNVANSFGVAFGDLYSETTGKPYLVGIDCLGNAGIAHDTTFWGSSRKYNVPVVLDSNDHVLRVEYRGTSVRFFVDGKLAFDDTVNRASGYGDLFGVWSQGVQLYVKSVSLYELAVSSAQSTSGSTQSNAFDAVNYYADLGNPESEAQFDLNGWSGSQDSPENLMVSPSGDTSKRFQLVDEDNSLVFSPVIPGSAYLLKTEVDDGGCDDSFEILANGSEVYSFTALDAPDTVRAHDIAIPPDLISGDRLIITFRNTTKDGCGLAAVYNARLTKSD